MIKIIILSCFVCWAFIRQFSKSKPDSIWRIKLKRLSQYVLIGAVFWLITIMFGPEKYQIYTDKIYNYQGKVQTVFAWKDNRVLPIYSLATPVLLSLDYKTVYSISGKSAAPLKKQFPYAPYKLGYEQYLGTLLFALLVLAYLSRHRHIDRKWQEAIAADNKLQYEGFKIWSKSNLFRRLHCKSMAKKADIAMQSIDQRGRLKLDMYRYGYAEKNINAPFLDMLSQVVKTGHQNVMVKATHDNNFKPISDSTNIEITAYNSGALEPCLFMKKYYEHLKDRALKKEEPAAFDSYVLSTPEHLRFSYPEPNISNGLLEKQLVNVLNRGKKRFTGDELVTFINETDCGTREPNVCLEISYMCQLERYKGKRKASVWAGELSHKTITMDGVDFPAGHMLWFVFGMSFNWKLVIDGVEVLEGHCGTFPDSNVCNKSRPVKRDMPAKAEVEKQIFEVVALSNISAFFAQLTGVTNDSINQHVIELDKKTALGVKEQTEKSNQLAESLEEALRGEALEELLLSSGKELYLKNKEEVDAVIGDYIKTHGDTDTILMIIDMLDGIAPELTSGLLDIIGGSDE